MPDREASLEQVIPHIRSALTHLYDQVYLQNHPLAAWLGSDTTLDRVSRAQWLRKLLLDCIEGLRPQKNAPAEAARAYVILAHRYVDGLSMPAIASKLSLSERQVYRGHEKGIKAIANLFLDKVGQDQPELSPLAAALDPEGDQIKVAQAEVERLRENVQAESLHVEEILEGVVTMLTPMSQQAGVEIQLTLPKTLPEIMADRTMLRQALVSLLSQALRTVRGDVFVTARQEQNQVWVEIVESANATRKGSGLSSPTESAGVGLAVAQALIESQGGQLQLNLREGEWKARIAFPAVSRLGLVMIDDNANIVSLVQRYLSGRAVSVMGVTDARQAIHVAAELQPQAIMLDVMMPQQDGWEILQRLKATPETAHIPVIICSVLNEPQLAFSMGASDYITKPVNQSDLLRTLQRWLGPLPMAAQSPTDSPATA